MQAEVYVTGLRELRAAVKRADADLIPEMREQLRSVGQVVVSDAKRFIPRGKQPWDRHPGRAQDSVRVTVSGTTVYIVGGKKSVPYYAWLEFGGELKPVGRRRNRQWRPLYPNGRYIRPAVERNESKVVQAVNEAFDNVKRSVNL